ncbi:hypothetical protein FDECE_11935 [Fusarium decemcellulare]|nr:hypothetical protein FDECE_11935 [Fusarium decemcellulare]
MHTSGEVNNGDSAPGDSQLDDAAIRRLLHDAEKIVQDPGEHPTRNGASSAPAPDNTTANTDALASSSKTPKKTSRKAPTNKASLTSRGITFSVKKFKEDMIEYLLDHWKARAQVVYTNDQQDATALWSPQWAGCVTQRGGVKFFDGFDRTWFIPFDIETPLPAAKKHIADDLRQRGQEMKEMYEDKKDSLKPRLMSLFEDEIKMKYRDQWYDNLHEVDEVSTQWAEVINRCTMQTRVHMVAKARLIESSTLLPEYYNISILDLAVDGKMIVRQARMPFDINLTEFYLRLNSWCPADGEHDLRILEIFRNRVAAVSLLGTQTGKDKAQKHLKELDKPNYRIGAPGSEMSSWVYKLGHNGSYTVPPGKLPADVKGWKKFKEESFEEFLASVRVGKYPAVIRVSILTGAVLLWLYLANTMFNSLRRFDCAGCGLK